MLRPEHTDPIEQNRMKTPKIVSAVIIMAALLICTACSAAEDGIVVLSSDPAVVQEKQPQEKDIDPVITESDEKIIEQSDLIDVRNDTKSETVSQLPAETLENLDAKDAESSRMSKEPDKPRNTPQTTLPVTVPDTEEETSSTPEKTISPSVPVKPAPGNSPSVPAVDDEETPDPAPHSTPEPIPEVPDPEPAIPIPAPEPEPSEEPAAAYTDATNVRSAFMKAINTEKAANGAPEGSTNGSLNSIAQDRARQMAANCAASHIGGGYPEAVGSMGSSGGAGNRGRNAVHHSSQLMTCTSFGIGVAIGSDGMYYYCIIGQ